MPGTRRRVVLFVEADGDPCPRPIEGPLYDRDPRLGPPVEIVFVHPEGTAYPRGTARWLDARRRSGDASAPDATAVHDWHHLLAGREADAHRVARRLTDRGVGLVLGGGGALAGAHVGALAALLERGIPLDYVGGTSAGAGIAAVAALHLSYEPTHDLIHLEFFDRTPFALFTLPVLSIFARGPMDATAQRLFGDRQVEDLWIPWFGVSASLERAELVVHRRGPLWKLTRASSSVPVVAPPVVHAGETLVDGGLLDNYPATVLRRLCGGTVIGVNLQASAERTIDYSYEELPSAVSILAGRARDKDLPTLAYVTLRVATLGAAANAQASADATDLYLTPELADFTPADFGLFEPIAREGYACTRDALDLTDLPALRGGSPTVWAAPRADLGPPDVRFGQRQVLSTQTPAIRSFASRVRQAVMGILRGQAAD